jgi:hypothetical protein
VDRGHISFSCAWLQSDSECTGRSAGDVRRGGEIRSSAKRRPHRFGGVSAAGRWDVCEWMDVGGVVVGHPRSVGWRVLVDASFSGARECVD